MSRRALRSRTEICQLCDFMITRGSPLRQPNRPHRPFNSRSFTTTRRHYTQTLKSPNGSAPLATKRSSQLVDATQAQDIPGNLSEDQLHRELTQAAANCTAIIHAGQVPSEEEVLQALRRCNKLAELVVSEWSPAPLKSEDRAASALLSLDESSTTKDLPPKLPASIQYAINHLSEAVFKLVEHSTVFITPGILELYVKIQANLGKPETFPQVFDMYANKPLPQEGGSTLKFRKPNPDKVSNAVPIATADRALQTAIDSRQLGVAMDIVETTYATKAFRRAKFVRKGLLPTTGVVVAPVAAYTVASQLAVLQTTMDSTLATNIAFAGIMAYTFFTGTIGVVALTTANDQMDRVTWAPGMPLRERWAREEERAAMDKIAQAWGFREKWRRGEEEGDDWDALREWIGGKGMILDRVELMEGME